ncbi:MAG TPA: F0F1 ATP synthase subunit A [Sulfuricella sp.]|nr:F0F1 ATP synthase subunit A [Sulfuricella sp.]
MEKASVIFHIGPFGINETIVITWAIMLGLGLFSWLATRRLTLDPGPLQTSLEGIVSAIEDAIRTVLPDKAQMVLPFIGTLWIFILVANLTGLIPGLSSPTGNLSVTAGLAILVFLSVHWFGLRSEGWRNYLRHYTRPSPILLPFHVISEISRTVALAVRLFGNIMSLEMAALLVLLVAGPLVPVPLLMLHIVEALVQAYIFGMLALIYVSGAMQSQQLQMRKQGESHE